MIPEQVRDRRADELAFDGLEVHGLGLAALVLLEVEAHFLVLRERTHSGALHGSDVNEGVLTSIVGRDEAIAFGIVKKFDCAYRHLVIPSYSGGPPIGPPALGEAKEGMRSRKAPEVRPFATSSENHIGALRFDCNPTAFVRLATYDFGRMTRSYGM